MSPVGTRPSAASNSKALRLESGGGMVMVRGSNGLDARSPARSPASVAPSTTARPGCCATASRNQRMMAATWLRNSASSPATASMRSTKITAGVSVFFTASSSMVSSRSGLNTRSTEISWTSAPAVSAATATSSTFPTPEGPSRTTPATSGRPQDRGKSSSVVRRVSHPVSVSSSLSSPATSASAVVGDSVPGSRFAEPVPPSVLIRVRLPTRPVLPGSTERTRTSTSSPAPSP